MKQENFLVIQKNSSWNVFVTVTNEVLQALTNLGPSDTRSEADKKSLELFFVQLYCRHKISPNIHHLAALKWHMFPKQQLDSQKLSPKSSLSTLHRSSVQISYRPLPSLPDPGDCGLKWDRTNSLYKAVTTTLSLT